MDDIATHEAYRQEVLKAMRQLGYEPKDSEVLIDAGMCYIKNGQPVSKPYDYTHIRVWYKEKVFGIWDTKRKTFVD